MIQGILLFLLFIFFIGIVIVAYIAATALRLFHKAKDSVEGKKRRKSTTIVDTRSKEVAERKIFDKDEGEYVDFTEQ